MKYLIFIFALFFVFSCGKKRTISGRVYNPITGNGIEGVVIAEFREKFCLSYDGCPDKALETATTDANGYYSMPYRDKKKGQYILFNYGVDDNYYRIRTTSHLDNSNRRFISGNQVYDLLLATKGYMQLSITNVNCFDNNDKLTITNLYHKSIPELINSGVSEYNDCFNQTFNNSFVAMGWWIALGTVTKNNITTPFADSVYVPEGGSVQWNIEY